MVVWLFAGGGEAEVRGLVPFLKKQFTDYSFYRMTPVLRKPGPRPGIKIPAYGKTGKSLIIEIKERLKTALSMGENCDIILVFDDLDCRDIKEQHQKLLEAIDSVVGTKKIIKIIGFAAPELESWIIADWDNSIGKHVDFRNKRRYVNMRHWLSTTKNIPFATPESFSKYDEKRDTCDEKMSEAIIESSMLTEEDQSLPRYSKAYHTPILLLQIDCQIVKNKCPIFRQLYDSLNIAKNNYLRSHIT